MKTTAATQSDPDLFDILSHTTEILDGDPCDTSARQPLFPQTLPPPKINSLPALVSRTPVAAVPAVSMACPSPKSGKPPSAAASSPPKMDKKRTWKKPKDKPKRPLSAYNLFFQAERARIITSSLPSSSKEKVAEFIRPDRCRRRHRKTHGKIGFADLARDIAAKWKALDDVAKEPFANDAMKEKERYWREMELWNKSQEEKKDHHKEKNKSIEKKKRKLEVCDEVGERASIGKKSKTGRDVAKSTKSSRPVLQKTTSIAGTQPKFPKGPMSSKLSPVVNDSVCNLSDLRFLGSTSINLKAQLLPSQPQQQVRQSNHPYSALKVPRSGLPPCSVTPNSLAAMLASAHTRHPHKMVPSTILQSTSSKPIPLCLPWHQNTLSQTQWLTQGLPNLTYLKGGQPDHVSPPNQLTKEEGVARERNAVDDFEKKIDLILNNCPKSQVGHLEPEDELNIKLGIGIENKRAMPSRYSTEDDLGGGDVFQGIMTSLKKLDEDFDTEFIDFLGGK